MIIMRIILYGKQSNLHSQEAVCGAQHLIEHVLSTVGISVEEGGRA